MTKSHEQKTSAVDEIRFTASGIPVKAYYTPDDIKGIDYTKDLGNPGEYPLTRSPFAAGYRGGSLGVRPVQGYGLPEEANQRIKYLLNWGMQAAGGIPTFSLTCDMPSLYGYDSDNPGTAYQVGLGGPPLTSIEDMDACLKDIPLEGTYCGILSHNPWRLALFIAVAENRGVPRQKLMGAFLGDPLNGRIGDGGGLFPPRPCLRLMVDLLKFSVEQMPDFRVVDFQGYSIREAGSNAPQEVGFSIAQALEVIRACLAIGIDIDDLAPHMTFYFGVHSDFFEEVAKLRAARKIWARVMREQFGAKNKRNWRMRFMVKTSATNLPAKLPLLNISRGAIRSLAAVFGGATNLFVTAWDEALASPTEQSMQIALLTGKIVEQEVGVTDVADPLGGSFYVEYLTHEIEKRIWDCVEKIEQMGGFIAALENGYLQREMAIANLKECQELESGRRTVIGVNKFVPEKDEVPFELMVEDAERVRKVMVERLQNLRKRRDDAKVKSILEKIRQVADGKGELMPLFIDAAKALCTTGEVHGVMRDVWGWDRQGTVPARW